MQYILQLLSAGEKEVRKKKKRGKRRKADTKQEIRFKSDFQTRNKILWLWGQETEII